MAGKAKSSGGARSSAKFKKVNKDGMNLLERYRSAVRSGTSAFMRGVQRNATGKKRSGAKRVKPR